MEMSVSSVGPGGGPKYVNVLNRDVFLVSLIYSKASLGFLCLIGLMSSLNTILFIDQLSKAEPLCMFNNYLPYGNQELRQDAMPVVYYCRLLGFSVPVTFIQLILCILALTFGLNRRSMLFFAAYCFLWMMLLYGAAFFVGLFILNYEDSIRDVFENLLDWVIANDEAFCWAMEPFIHCRVPRGPNGTDLIAELCQTERKHHPFLADDCTEYSTAYLIDRTWLLAVAVEYFIVILVGLYATTRGIIRYRQKRQRDVLRSPVGSFIQRPHSATGTSAKLIRAGSSEVNSAATL